MMKNLSGKNKLMIVLAAAVLLVVSYFASGNNAPEQKLEEAYETAAVLTETATEGTTGTAVSESILQPSTEMTDEQANTEETKPIEAEPTTEKPAEPKTEKIAEPTTEPKTEKPATAAEVRAEKTCTLSVNCSAILDNISNFDQNKLGLLPADGMIFPPQKAEFKDGETVFDVLKREMTANGIHFEFSQVPAYNSAYIEGINNIYEFDCGELSGWMYTVNGEFPGYGCNMYKLNDGDVVEWVYTCDLGRDVGDVFEK